MNRDIVLATILVLSAATFVTTAVISRLAERTSSLATVQVAPETPDTVPPPPAVDRPVIPIRPTTQPQNVEPSQTRRGPARSRARAPRPIQRPVNAPPVSEPVAREALTRVGFDPAAEAVWVRAINDSTLSGNERRNLIEDLNETGFANPRRLTIDDLPLIESRIAIIEQLAPDAMDDVNAAAFDEAYRDLLTMRERATGQ